MDHEAPWLSLHQIIFRRWAGEALLEKFGMETRPSRVTRAVP